MESSENSGDKRAGGERMNEEQYIQTLQQIMLLVQIVNGLPLREFIAAGRHAEDIGPIVNPTLWIKASANLAEVIHLAESLRKFQAEVERQIEVIR
jgi:hypothetical protein